MTNNNYNDNRTTVNSITSQRRVNPHHDMNAILFDDTNTDHTIVGGEEGVSAAVDILADAENTLFVACTNKFTFQVQLTDDAADNPDWYDYCDGDGNAVSLICQDAKKAIPVSAKARQLRVVASNGGSTDEAPYVGLM